VGTRRVALGHAEITSSNKQADRGTASKARTAGIGATLAHNVSGFVEVKAEERGHGQEAYSVGGQVRLVW
jgi:hypothetical protein